MKGLLCGTEEASEEILMESQGGRGRGDVDVRRRKGRAKDEQVDVNGFARGGRTIIRMGEGAGLIDLSGGGGKTSFVYFSVGQFRKLARERRERRGERGERERGHNIG